MHYTSQYPSPLGELLLAADDDGLTGVWFVGQKYFARSLAPDSVAREIPLFAQVSGLPSTSRDRSRNWKSPSTWWEPRFRRRCGASSAPFRMGRP